MKPTTLFFLCLFYVVGSTAAQSLTEVAKKEKKRREDARTEGTVVQEYSDAEGSLGRAPLEKETESEPDTDTELEDEEDEHAPGHLAGDVEGDSRERALKDTVAWKSIYGEYKVRYRYLENLMDMREQEASRWCSPPPHNPDPKEWRSDQERYRQRCQDAREKQKKLRADMRAMQSECLVEAKPHGVSPGDARLGR